MFLTANTCKHMQTHFNSNLFSPKLINFRDYNKLRNDSFAINDLIKIKILTGLKESKLNIYRALLLD